ncbi:uncharacterized protein LOC110390688 [Numida meleagris]|uniref:uncharacterized protein LOC110390688 n=1 Tax=Numida meleagris TaxID=8996 RepID=UPI000B3E1DF0|nr:uncharacterized protein LOC110390688 [Numida meleagris]
MGAVLRPPGRAPLDGERRPRSSWGGAGAPGVARHRSSPLQELGGLSGTAEPARIRAGRAQSSGFTRRGRASSPCSALVPELRTARGSRTPSAAPSAFLLPSRFLGKNGETSRTRRNATEAEVARAPLRRDGHSPRGEAAPGHRPRLWGRRRAPGPRAAHPGVGSGRAPRRRGRTPTTLPELPARRRRGVFQAFLNLINTHRQRLHFHAHSGRGTRGRARGGGRSARVFAGGFAGSGERGRGHGAGGGGTGRGQLPRGSGGAVTGSWGRAGCQLPPAAASGRTVRLRGAA